MKALVNPDTVKFGTASEAADAAAVGPAGLCEPSHGYALELSVGVTCHPEIHEIEGLFTQARRPTRSDSKWRVLIPYLLYQTRHCV